MSWNWRSLLKATAVTSLAISVFGIVVFQPDVAFFNGLLVGVGLFWMRRPGRAGVIYLGVIHFLIGLVVLLLFENIKELAYPASWKVFVSTGARLVATVTAIVAAVGALLQRSGKDASRSVAAMALVALLSVTGIGIGSRLTVSEESRQPGDVLLRITPESEWSTRELRVSAGRVFLYVKNDDVHHGSFTIDGIVSSEIPAETAKRMVFNVSPGRYRYYSKLYPGEPGMRGTLEAS